MNLSQDAKNILRDVGAFVETMVFWWQPLDHFLAGAQVDSTQVGDSGCGVSMGPSKPANLAM